MKLKTKVAFGSIFLFFLLIVVGSVSVFYLNRIAGDARLIVRDNYETLLYSKNMLAALDDAAANQREQFEKYLIMQEKNITEPGEKEATSRLREDFNSWRVSPGDSQSVDLRKGINRIMELNLAAIDEKNTQAQQTSRRAATIISVILTFCFLAGFAFLFNFPSLIAGPVAKLTESIRAIANRNYSERIHIERRDEFGELAAAFNEMAERLDEYEHSQLAKIMFEKKRAETVIHSLRDASIGVDRQGIILFANEQALQLLHLREIEIVGKQQAVVRDKSDLFRYLVDEHSNVPFKVVVGNRENYFTKEVIELAGETGGIVIVVKNITSFKELDVAKTNFIATVSHELKTPLASFDFSLKLLEDKRTGMLNGEQLELVKAMKLDNQRMLKILSELLNMSQAEAGKIQLEMNLVDPKLVVEAAILGVVSAKKERSITLSTTFDQQVDAVWADADKTTWVLNNLLTNAIRHTPVGGSVETGYRRIGDYVEFYVGDSGPGIPGEYTSKIFERFFKVPGRAMSGTGIGLSISKEMIEAQGGEIGFNNREEGGALFYFRLRATIPSGEG